MQVDLALPEDMLYWKNAAYNFLRLVQKQTPCKILWVERDSYTPCLTVTTFELSSLRSKLNPNQVSTTEMPVGFVNRDVKVAIWRVANFDSKN